MHRYPLNASSAKCWLSCTAQPRFILENRERIPEDTTAFADEGIEAHAAASVALTLGWDESISEDADIRQHVKDYTEYVEAVRDVCDGVLLVEQKVPLWFYREKNGYIDAAVLSQFQLDIIDLKYGMGDSVAAEDNPQLYIYARSLLETLWSEGRGKEVKTIGITIYQPRVLGEEAIRTVTLSVEKLLDDTDAIADVAAKILTGAPGEFKPSDDTCRFCEAKLLCTARAEQLLTPVDGGTALIRSDATEVQLPPVGSLTQEQQIKLFLVADGLRAYLQTLKDAVRQNMINGVRYPGLKLVKGRGSRAWRSEKEAVQLLSNCCSIDEIYEPRKVISPAQAEKLLKAKDPSKRLQTRFKEIVNKFQGQPLVAVASDPQPSVAAAETNDFVNLEAETSNSEILD